jgi:hypothetical protein
MRERDEDRIFDDADHDTGSDPDRNRVEHRLLSVPRAEHGLDGADQVTIDEMHDQVIAFLRDHLVRTR